LNISPSTLLLQPNEKSFFTVTIDPIVSSKMRWGKLTIIAENQVSVLEEVASLGAGVKIKPAISVIVYAHTDQAMPDAEIFTPEKIDSGYSVLIRNTGDSKLKAKVTFLLTNVRTGDEVEINEMAAGLLPGEEKTLITEIPDHEYPKAMLTVLMDYSPNEDLKGVQIVLD